MNQEKYLEMQMLNSELQEIKQQLDNASKQVNDLQALDDTLTDFSQVKAGTEALTAIGNGIFAKSRIEDTKEVVMTVGANVSVTKPIADVKSTVKAQIEDIQKIIPELQNALGNGVAKMQCLQQELAAEAKNKKK